ncbi:MAG: hypothetical protein ACK5XN_31860 [Bacteroidota bacterium]|jgi:hypothetical protein
MKMGYVKAPWTPHQVANLNAFQKDKKYHPFTRDGKILIATTEGWVTEEGGDVVQDWAWDIMVNYRGNSLTDYVEAYLRQ